MSSKISLVVQSFGHEHEYRRAIFCVWSFYAHAAPGLQDTKLLLFTDNPEFFTPYLSDLPIQYVLLTPEKMLTMRGETDFVHRVKIAVIQEAFEYTKGSIMYVDSDAFFTSDPTELFQKLSPATCFMHTNEYPFDTLARLPLPSGAPFREVLKLLEEKEFMMAEGRFRKFPPSLFSWNAGVILLHHDHKSLLADVFLLSDQLFRATGNHASEQYAFSIVLQVNMGVRACDEFVYHYWYRVKKEVADDLFARNLNASWAALQNAEKKLWVKSRTVRFPAFFDQHSRMLKDNAIQAFNSNDFRSAYRWVSRALLKDPFDLSFLKNCAYHTKRRLSRRYNG